MNEFFDQLLQLKNLSMGDPSVSLEWARPFPAWAWALLVPACFGSAVWSYSRMSGGRSARFALAGVRALALLVIAVLIAGPQLVKQTQRIEKDWVAVLVDRSASMLVADAPGGKTRDAQLRDAITDAWPALKELGQQRNLVFLGFDGATFELGAKQDGTGIELPQPAGARTRLGVAIQQALHRLAAKPVAGLLVISDGRSGDSVPREAMRELEARKIPVFVSALGSEKPSADVAIVRVDAPGNAFVNDFVPVEVEFEASGGDGAIPPGRIELFDQASGKVLNEQPLPRGSQSGRVTLITRPGAAGSGKWGVRIIPDQPDLSPENNSEQVGIEVADRPIRVAYFDGYPRWEYRYLKNTLVREESIRSAVTLLSSERRYLREGTEPMVKVPQTPEEWSVYDVIIIGDLRPDLFSPEQLKQIRSLVASRGAGLLWLGGPAATPAAWKSTPLADLVPFSLASFDAGVRGANVWLDPVVMKPGDAVERFGVLQLADDPVDPWPKWLSQGELGWTLLRWAQRIDPRWLKPTAEVLAVASPDAGGPGAERPLVMTMRYGAGRVAYVGTDEIWRYRYGRGETLPERFWIPIVRLLARESLGRTGRAAVLDAAPTRSRVDQQIQLSARLLDQSLIDASPKSIVVRLSRVTEAGVDDKRPPTTVELRPASGQEEDPEMTPVSAFTAAWVAPSPGRYVMTSPDALLADLGLETSFEVVAPDDELRVPQADHQSLNALAEATGGQAIAPSWLSSLRDALPNRELRILGLPEIETLWDKPIAWLVLMGLLVVEWIGRRIIRLS
ncbi:MAG: hypothetical protein ACOYN0_01840 [Phycisphaerales bacterium]